MALKFLPAWPSLSRAKMVIPPRIKEVENRAVIRLTTGIFEAAGLDLRSVSVTYYRGRALFRQGDKHRSARTQRIILPLKGLSKAAQEGSIGIVVGPGYVVVTSWEDAQQLGGGAPEFVLSSAGVRLRYKRLRCAPDLEPATVVHLGMRSAQQLTLSLTVLREAGLMTAKKVFAGVHSGRLFLQTDAKYGTPVALRPHGLVVHHSELGPDISPKAFAVVRGPGYLVVTSQADAKVLGGGAPAAKASQKTRAEEVRGQDGTLTLSQDEIFAWSDRSLVIANKKRRTNLIAQIGGVLLKVVGLDAGSTLRLTRYANATLAEPCAKDDAHALEVKSNRGYPRIYVGSSVLPLDGLEHVRAIATARGLVFTDPKGPLGRLCPKSRELPRSLNQQAALIASHPEAAVLPSAANSKTGATGAGVKLGLAQRTLGTTKNACVYPLKPKQARIQVQGQWLTQYGFVPGARYRIEAHPLFRSRMLAVLDEKGPHQVTTLTGTTPKLYVPRRYLEHFGQTTEFKVFGASDGLHIHSANSKIAAARRGSIRSIAAAATQATP